MNDLHFVDVFRGRVLRQSSQVALGHLSDDGSVGMTSTYAELDRQARSIGAWLQRHGLVGERVLLVYRHSREFLPAFLGCLYARATAVPTLFPQRPRFVDRVNAIRADAGPRAILTSAETLKACQQAMDDPVGLETSWLATDRLDDESAGWVPSRIEPSTLAFLQYTSGSTASPRGVMVTHASLWHNLEVVRHAIALKQESVELSWLPFFHDMGLVGAMLAPLSVGCQLYLMQPASFMQQPLGWLQAITRYRATHSGGPNFAFDHCVRGIRPEQRQGLDLSSWRVAWNGAEPIQHATLERFHAAFADCGFSRTAFYPCYGLAEATLGVAGSAEGQGAVERQVDALALSRHQAVSPGGAPDVPGGDAPGARAVCLVSSGRVGRDLKVVIVHPETRQECPDESIGEIWVSGPSVALGYWGQPRQSTETFAARTAGGQGPFLRTGDLGFLWQGELFVTGRLKELIILRGRNYYPADLEQTACNSHPALQSYGGAAFGVCGADGAERLVLVHEVRREALRGLQAEEVFATIRPAVTAVHEVTVSTIVLLKPGQLPRTSSGKIRRQACAAAFLTGALECVARWQEDLPSRPGSLPPSELLAADLLGRLRRVSPEERLPLVVEHVGHEVQRILRLPNPPDPRTGFTELGMDSLMAVELRNRLQGQLGDEYRLSSTLAFEQSNVEALATHLAQALVKIDDVKIHEEAEPGLNKQPALPTRAPPAQASKNAAALPLSAGQAALWFLYQLAPEKAAYNTAFAYRSNTALDAGSLAIAFSELIKRHPVLRMTVRETDAGPRHELKAHLGGWLHFHDVADALDNEVQALLAKEIKRPFDLEAGPVFRVDVYTQAPNCHYLLFTQHHISTDAYSLNLLMEQWQQLYWAALAGRPVVVREPARNYAELIQSQNAWLEGPEAEAELAYWRQRLAGALPLLQLPTDRPHPPLQTFAGDTVDPVKIDEPTTKALREFARRHDATLAQVLLAAYCVLLHRYSRQDTVLVGMPSLGRPDSRFDNVVGYFVNPVVVRSDWSADDSLARWLGRVRETAVGALAHSQLPFPELVNRLQLERASGRSPVFQTMFSLLSQSLLSQSVLSWKEAPEAAFEFVAMPQMEGQFDVVLQVLETPDTLIVEFKYNTDVFDRATIERMARHYLTLLGGLLADPACTVGTLPLLSEAERRQLLVEWNDTAAEYPHDRCLHQLFEEQVERTPAAVAVEFEGRQLTYTELNGRANQLAHHLRGLGIGPETLVGICVERSLEMVVGLLAILKAGGAYVPLDPAYPAQRLAFMMADSKAAVLLTQQRLRGRVPAGAATVVCLDADWEVIGRGAATDPAPAATPENLAYVIYTSGSTGRPKGVAMPQRPLVNLLHWQQGQSPVRLGERTLQFTTLSFDVAFQEILSTCCAGGTLVLMTEDQRLELSRRPQFLVEQGVNRLFLPFVALQQLAEGCCDQDVYPECLREVITAGEQLQITSALARLFSRLPGCALHNQYGPTESHVVTAYALTGVPSGWPMLPPIGRPIANSQVYVLDQNQQLLPPGVPGELYLGGACLARGYLDRPELTAERFVARPFDPGTRLYRTGDLVRWLPDGNLQFLGRSDSQVKILGYRIEPGEIETILAGHVGVREAAVVVREDQPGNRRLVAYVVAKGRPELSASELRGWLRSQLPDYMVPSAFVCLDALPLTPSGKVDHRALPAPEGRPQLEHAYVAPRSPLETQLCQIWQEVLKLPRVGVHDNFFELGGHSLLATQVLSRVRQALLVDVPLRSLFQDPTVAKLALAITECQGKPGPGQPDSGLITRVSQAEDVLLSRLDQLSDDEVDSLLRDLVDPNEVNR